MIYYQYKGHKGERYFKVNDELSFPQNQVIIQVVADPGDTKPGRVNCRGIYEIRKQTLASNYAFLPELVPCDKDTFDTAFNKVLKLLQ